MVTAASREFQVMVKPIGALCNLGCDYCYYLDKQRLYPDAAAPRMPDDLLEAYIVQHIAAAPRPLINFQWHGGEPTLLGLDYFRKIVALQRKHQPAGRQITNGLQTNGTTLDEEWCRFLAAEGFFVGLSLDGPQALHDRHRVTKGQKPTHKAVMRAFRLLQQHRVRLDILCVVHADNAGSPMAVYRFFKEIGARHLQFLPFVEPLRDGSGGVTLHSVPPLAYGEFLCAIFDEWVRQDVGRVTVQLFDEAARPACGLPHALCHFREECGDVPVVEHNGDFYACDHFVDPAHRLGNIRETPLAALLDSEPQIRFGQAKRETLPRYCRECDVLALCNGGCPKDRFIKTPDGEPGLNYLCAGFKRFFAHSRPALERLAAVWRAGQPMERLMQEVRAADQSATRQAGRNDLCPCGSGKKYKRCCLGKPAR
ncbi:MAG: anaerobic sulfatase maturase [Candidatus Rokubacteria bacterium GWC2_70_16]|nr:MAG: anaerobic sulfatase maturase [Candidatus Rokubacteria bacterium GWC2_70_16]